MSFAVNDWVQHPDGEGAVVEVARGFQDSFGVVLFDENRIVWSPAADLTALGAMPAKEVGDIVTFAGLSGVVLEVVGTLYLVEATYRLPSRLVEATNRFWVQRWQFEV